MIDKSQKLSIRSQCKLLFINRSTLFYKDRPPSNDAELANQIHDIWMEMPFYGYRRFTAELNRRGHHVNHKRIQRLMREMKIKALYPKKRTTVISAAHKKYPHLLNGVKIMHSNQVWATDITYIRHGSTFIYLVALIDIFSRYVLDWRISNTMDVQFCTEMLCSALKKHGAPEILNTDQGSQFTSKIWIEMVQQAGAKVSMDGKGRWVDNVYIERFWRTIKHEHILYQDYENVREARSSIGDFIELYNTKRLHQNLGYRTPSEVYKGVQPIKNLKLVYGNVENADKMLTKNDLSTMHLHTVPQTQQQVIL